MSILCHAGAEKGAVECWCGFGTYVFSTLGVEIGVTVTMQFKVHQYRYNLSVSA